MRFLTVPGGGAVTALAFSADTAFLAALAGPADVHVFAPGTGKVEFVVPDSNFGRDLAFGLGGELLAFVEDGRPAFGPPGQVRVLPGEPPQVRSRESALSPDGRRLARLAMRSDSADVYCLDLPGGQEVWRSRIPLYMLPSVRYTPDGLRVAVVATFSARYYDAETGAEVGGFGKPTAVVAGIEMPACAFSHEGRLLAVQRPNRLAVVGAEQGRLRRAFPDVIVPGSALAFAPGSRFLATAAEPTGVRFWETTSWGEQPVFDPGIGSIHSLTFSPDGLLAAAGGEDGRVAVWDWG